MIKTFPLELVVIRVHIEALIDVNDDKFIVGGNQIYFGVISEVPEADINRKCMKERGRKRRGKTQRCIYGEGYNNKWIEKKRETAKQTCRER